MREKRDTTEPVSCVPLNKQPSSKVAASYRFSSVNQISLCGVCANKGVACGAWCNEITSGRVALCIISLMEDPIHSRLAHLLVSIWNYH